MQYGTLVVGLLIGLSVGGVAALIATFLFMKGRIAVAEAKEGSAIEKHSDIQSRLTEAEVKNDEFRGIEIGDKAKIAELSETIEQERVHNKEKLDLLDEAKEKLSNQFKTLANDILEEKSKKFTDLNKTNLNEILDPFKEKITDFKKKVEDVYVSDTKDRTALAEQIKMLTELNNTLSEDAQNLTHALKGDSKALGNWGELLLEDVLERAGLVRDQHYTVQESVKTAGGLSHKILDVVIHLPGGRNIVIDSKMTLPDYRAFASAEEDGEKADSLKRHLKSIRTHMKGLSEKNYQTLYGISSLDFVIMFVPLEPAFMLAVTHDRELFHDAWEKNVLPVSPSTLLFVIRTIANLWRQEDLSRNAQDISKRGAELYDKLVGFVKDLQQVGERLALAQDSYEKAKSKLSEGKGNAIRQAEMLKELGVKPSKSLPPPLVEIAMERPVAALSDDVGSPSPASEDVG